MEINTSSAKKYDVAESMVSSPNAFSPAFSLVPIKVIKRDHAQFAETKKRKDVVDTSVT